MAASRLPCRAAAMALLALLACCAVWGASAADDAFSSSGVRRTLMQAKPAVPTPKEGAPTDPKIKALCDKAQTTLPNDANVKAFVECAKAASGKIPQDCCTKLVGLADFLPCLGYKMYIDQVNSFIKPITFDKARTDCLS